MAVEVGVARVEVELILLDVEEEVVQWVLEEDEDEDDVRWVELEVDVGLGVEDELLSLPPSPPLPNSHEPERTPVDSEPRSSNNPLDRSRAPYGQPMHSSTMVA